MSAADAGRCRRTENLAVTGLMAVGEDEKCDKLAVNGAVKSYEGRGGKMQDAGADEPTLPLSELMAAGTCFAGCCQVLRGLNDCRISQERPAAGQDFVDVVVANKNRVL